MNRRDFIKVTVPASLASYLPPFDAEAEGRSASGPEVPGSATPLAEIRFEIKAAGLKPEVSDSLSHWGGKGPGGTLSANTCFLEKEGRPLAIVAGEIHHQRVPVEEWESSIVQMKAAGLNTVSSYTFWNQIERKPGEFDFSERNDIRQFVSICKKHGMMVIARIGPFCNAEFLTGGLPIWLYGMPVVERSNDPLFLKLVARYYNALASQLRDLIWQDGGPIAFVQVENEVGLAWDEWTRPFLYAASFFGSRGPSGSGFTEYYRNLHALAVSSGLAAPFFTVTGWGVAGPLPIEAVMPTFGGYMYLGPPGPKNNDLTLFNYEGHEYDGKVPVGFSELGYGSPSSTGYRPRPPADSGYCTALTRLGSSRSLMVSYYMFRGGSNPINGDTGWTMKSPDQPLVSYDYWAPISESGEWRESLFRARPFNFFLQNYANVLALAESCPPLQPVTDSDDDRVRAQARMHGKQGFVFVSNYGNVRPLSDRKEFRLSLDIDGTAMQIPHTLRVGLASGTMGIWPVNLDLGAGVNLVSSTSQPMCRFMVGDAFWHVFGQTGTVPAEFVLSTETVSKVNPGKRGKLLASTALAKVVQLDPSRETVLEAVAVDGRKVHILLLSLEDTGRLSQLGTPSAPLLALSEAMVTRSDNSLSIASRTPAHLAVSIFPPMPAPSAGSASAVASDRDGVFQRFTFSIAEREVSPSVQHLSPDRALVQLDEKAFDGLDDIFLEVDFTGDVCRIFDATTGLLLRDFLNNELPWSVGLHRHRKALASGGLLVRAEPDLVTGPVTLSGGMTFQPGQRLKGAKPVLNMLTFHPRYAVSFSVPETLL